MFDTQDLVCTRTATAFTWVAMLAGAVFLGFAAHAFFTSSSWSPAFVALLVALFLAFAAGAVATASASADGDVNLLSLEDIRILFVDDGSFLPFVALSLMSLIPTSAARSLEEYSDRFMSLVLSFAAFLAVFGVSYILATALWR